MATTPEYRTTTKPGHLLTPRSPSSQTAQVAPAFLCAQWQGALPPVEASGPADRGGAVSLTFGSLFAGIGGMDLGLERAGMTCRWQVEIDPFCRRVLAKHWPDVARYEDVRDVGAHNLEPVDLIAGGFPCQDISNAGKRAGIDGERSGLWSEYARIIRELRPRYVLVENVAALLARGLDRVLGDLAESGYDAEWDCIPAAAVGALHRRDRLFILAHAADAGLEGYRRSPDALAPHGPGPDTAAGRGAGILANPHGERRTQRRSATEPVAAQLGCFERGGETLIRYRGGGGQWRTEPNVGRVAHGVPARVDRLRGLGNAVVPQVAEYIGRLILAHATDTEAVA